MGTIAISALDIGAMLVGGLIAHFAPKVVSSEKAECCDDEGVKAAKARFQAKVDELFKAIGA